MIKITSTIHQLYPSTALGIIEANVSIQKKNNELINKMEEFATQFKSNNAIEAIAQIPAINDTRSAYRAFGKEPARYRVSSEALLRRIVQGKGLYYINNVVDVNNLVSIESGHGICCFDRTKIEGDDILFTIADEGETYKGIGKGELNISKLPVFKDEKGSFGSPTSDSQRTMITDSTSKILFIIVSFSGNRHLDHNCQKAKDYLQTYCNAEITNYYIVG
ncbi:hypothetical protein EMN47_03555 [Prolixibacteraceae bacterium JC049]|nr:hypothetical protein [Prolixibacteraceae bacterium JC049]